jgi:hypothetical protein
LEKLESVDPRSDFRYGRVVLRTIVCLVVNARCSVVVGNGKDSANLALFVSIETEALAE